MPEGRVAEIIGQNLIIYRSSQHHGPNAQSNKDKCVLVSILRIQIRLEDTDHRFGNFPIRCLDGIAAASNVGRQTDQWTLAV
jgi:hypothetical protein